MEDRRLLADQVADGPPRRWMGADIACTSEKFRARLGDPPLIKTVAGAGYWI